VRRIDVEENGRIIDELSIETLVCGLDLECGRKLEPSLERVVPLHHSLDQCRVPLPRGQEGQPLDRKTWRVPPGEAALKWRIDCEADVLGGSRTDVFDHQVDRVTELLRLQPHDDERS